MILYLAQAYSKDPVAGIKNAHEYLDQLYDLGFDVFSPILHSHYHHEWLKKKHSLRYPDYVAKDLALVAAMCQDEDYNLELSCSNMQNKHCVKYAEYNCGSCELGHFYQPNVCMVFADDCWEDDQIGVIYDPQHTPIFELGKSHWVSFGAFTEYKFAREHHIKCIRLTELLEKKSIEDCEAI